MTVFTADPLNKNIPNYKEYSTSHYYAFLKKRVNFFESGEKGIFHHLAKVYTISELITDGILSHPEIKRFISLSNTTEKFDLIIISTGYHNGLMYLSEKLDVPMIAMSSFPGYVMEHYMAGELPLTLRSSDET